MTREDAEKIVVALLFAAGAWALAWMAFSTFERWAA